MQLNSLADFKRFLATPGATVQIIRHDWATSHNPKPGFFDPRKVVKVQSNGVAFESSSSSNGSWLYFDKASNYRFDGDKVTVDLKSDGTFDKVMVYKCWNAD